MLSLISLNEIFELYTYDGIYYHYGNNKILILKLVINE